MIFGNVIFWHITLVIFWHITWTIRYSVLIMILNWFCPGNMPKYYPEWVENIENISVSQTWAIFWHITWTKPHYYMNITLTAVKVLLVFIVEHTIWWRQRDGVVWDYCSWTSEHLWLPSMESRWTTYYIVMRSCSNMLFHSTPKHVVTISQDSARPQFARILMDFLAQQNINVVLFRLICHQLNMSGMTWHLSTGAEMDPT